MTSITKEWLQKTITSIESARDEIPFGLEEDQNNMLTAFKIALASLEAKPVAWTDDEELRDVKQYGFGEIFQCPPDKYADPRRVISLYREPPAVPAVLERLRAIVSDPRALPRRKEWVSGQQYSYVLLENVEAMVDEACRAAMLHSAEPVSQAYKLNALDGNSPVTQDGWVMVPKEPTQAMIKAWLSEIANFRGHAAGYRAALEAAPQLEVNRG
ncbi:hypothetical protein [Escherichia coli]|uniref:hypothetical protein n=1 Tax=Escherichia coli TaxID=562 RepID=UPI0031B5AC69